MKNQNLKDTLQGILFLVILIGMFWLFLVAANKY